MVSIATDVTYRSLNAVRHDQRSHQRERRKTRSRSKHGWTDNAGSADSPHHPQHSRLETLTGCLRAQMSLTTFATVRRDALCQGRDRPTLIRCSLVTMQWGTCARPLLLQCNAIEIAESLYCSRTVSHKSKLRYASYHATSGTHTLRCISTNKQALCSFKLLSHQASCRPRSKGFRQQPESSICTQARST